MFSPIINWTTQFPQRPLLGSGGYERDDESWQTAKHWSGRPDLEWTAGIMPERFAALAGRVPGYYYDDVNDFDTVHAMLCVGTQLRRLGHETNLVKPFAWPSVALGFRYFDSAYRSPDGRLRRGGPGDRFRGRHYVSGLDAWGLETIRFPNSWGPDWGDRGFGFIDRDYFEAYVETAFVRWSSVSGPSPTMLEWLERAGDALPYPRNLFACWPAPNRCATSAFEKDRRVHTLTIWQTMTLCTSSIVDVVELRNGAEIVGRLHVKHSEQASTITELFVRPRLRQRGYGQLLGETAAEFARAAGSPALVAWLRRGDDRPPAVAGAQALAARLNATWSEKISVLPPLAAVARIEL